MDGIQSESEEKRGEQPEEADVSRCDAAVEKRKVCEHEKGKRYARLVPIDVQVGSHRQDQTAERHYGAIDRESVSTEQDDAQDKNR